MEQQPQTQYVFDGSELDHDWLLIQAREMNPFAREAFLSVGLRSGDKAIDLGCGPLGALPVLAELVGPTGTVVGIDMSTASLARARLILDHLGLRSVRLVEADLNTLAPDALALGGPIDLAFARIVLMYQPDPATTLRTIAALVRPGGHVVATDVLRDLHYPRFDPPVSAAERVMHLWFALVEDMGGMVDIAQHYPEVCEQAGLRLVSQRGIFGVARNPRDYLAIYKGILSSMRENLLERGLATETEIEGLMKEIDSAMAAGQFGFAARVLQVEMVAQVP